MDIFKKPIVILIVGIAIVIALIWSYVSKTIEAKKTASEQNNASSVSMLDLTTVDAKDYDELIKTQLATANTEALKADSGNRLVAIEITLPSLLLKSGESRYIFTSPNTPEENWVMTFSEETGGTLRAKIPKVDYMGDLPAMNTSLWKYNYVTAIQIAEKNGGKEWRQTNGLYTAKATLKHGGENNWLIWYITYQSGDNTFEKQLDANSGKVLK